MINACFAPPSEPIKENELSGEYWSADAGKDDILHLFDDHEFTETYISPEGDTATNKGTWEFSEKDVSHFSVTLSGFRLLNQDWRKALSHYSGFLVDKPVASYALSADKQNGRITLTFDDDLGLRYVKVH